MSGSFSTSGGFLVVSQNTSGRIVLWDTATGMVAQEHVDQARLMGQVTSVNWLPQDLANKAAPRGEKRKKDKEVKNDVMVDDEQVALGLQNGGALIFSTTHSRIVNEIPSGSHAGPVRTVAGVAGESESRVYVGGEDGLVTAWNVENYKQAGKFTMENGKSVSALLSCEQGRRLIVASRAISVYDTKTLKVIATATGHEQPVIALVSPRLNPQADTTVFVSGAKGDRFLTVWELREKELTALISLVLANGNPLSVDVVRDNKKGDYTIAVVTDAGSVQIFRVSESSLNKRRSKKGDAKPLNPVSTIKVKDTTKKGQSVSILNAHLMPNNQLLMARGTYLRPVFEQVSFYNDDENTYIAEVELTRDRETNLVSRTHQTVGNTASTKGHKSVSDPTTINTSTMVRPNPKQSSDAAAPVNEETMEDRLLLLNVANGSVDPVAKSTSSTPKAQSLAAMLVQALHSEDAQLLEDCLGTTNATVVNATVRKLASAYVVPLLKRIVERFQAKPSRGAVLAVWIRTILIVHTSYIMANAELLQTLSSLYQLLDERLTVFKKFLKLSGRLDLILSQIAARTQEDDSDELKQAAIVYEEDDTDAEGSDEEEEEENENDENQMDEDENDNDEDEEDDDDEEEDDEEDDDDEEEDEDEDME